MAGHRSEDAGGINEEFEAIVSGLELPAPDDLPERREKGADAASADDDGASPDAAGADRHGDRPAPRRVEVALLLPGLDNVDAIAAVCRLSGVKSMCLPSDIGVIVCLDDPAYATALEAAAAFSGLLRDVPVVLLRRGPSDDPQDADVQASRWLGGTQQEPLAPGLILAQAPDVIEGLILGDLAARDVPGALDAAAISRLKATRILATLLRRQGRSGPPKGADGQGGAR